MLEAAGLEEVSKLRRHITPNNVIFYPPFQNIYAKSSVVVTISDQQQGNSETSSTVQPILTWDGDSATFRCLQGSSRQLESSKQPQCRRIQERLITSIQRPSGTYEKGTFFTKVWYVTDSSVQFIHAVELCSISMPQRLNQTAQK